MTRWAGIASSREGIEAIAQPTWRALRGSPSKRAMAPYVMTQPRGTSTTMAYTLSANICSNKGHGTPRVPRDYLQVGHQPRAGDAVPEVVAEPVRRMRSQVPLLLCGAVPCCRRPGDT